MGERGGGNQISNFFPKSKKSKVSYGVGGSRYILGLFYFMASFIWCILSYQTDSTGVSLGYVVRSKCQNFLA